MPLNRPGGGCGGEFGSPLAREHCSSYHPSPLHSPNTYRPVGTPLGGIWATLHMEMISINYHFPLWHKSDREGKEGKSGGGWRIVGNICRGWGVGAWTKEPRQQQHFSGVMCTVCNEQRKGHLTHFSQYEFIYLEHLIPQSPRRAVPPRHRTTARASAPGEGPFTASAGFNFPFSCRAVVHAQHPQQGGLHSGRGRWGWGLRAAGWSEMECGRSNHPVHHRKSTSLTFSIIGAFIRVQWKNKGEKKTQVTISWTV